MKKIIVFANTMKKIIVFGKHYEKIHSVRSVCKIIKIILTMTLVEKPKRPSSAYNEAISTKIGLKETEAFKECTRLIRKESYEFVRFLRSYKVHPFEFAIRSDRGDLRMNIKSFEPF